MKSAWRAIALALLALGGDPLLARDSAMFRANPQRTGSDMALPAPWILGEAWRFSTGGPIRSSPVLAGGRLLVGSNDGRLYALDPATGTEIWHLDAGVPVTGTPIVAGTTLFVTDRASNLHAVELATGRALWRVATDPAPRLRGGWDYFASSPAADDVAVYFGAGDGSLYAVARNDGRLLWRFRTAAPIRSSPLLVDRAVIVGSADGSLYRLDKATGRQAWRFDADGRTMKMEEWGYDRTAIQASPSLAGTAIMVGGRDGNVYGVDLKSGRRLWKKENGTGWMVSTAAIAGDRAIVGSSDGKFVQALDVGTGARLWETPVEGNALGSPLVAGDVVVIGSFDGRLRALEVGTGRVRWTIGMGGKILSSPAASPGMLYAASDAGAVVAFVTRRPEAKAERVYYDERGPGWRWSTFDSAAVHNRLEAAGYRAVNETGLKVSLSAQEVRGGRSVVVFLSDRLPAAAMDESGGKAPLRRYLEAGGKVVWMGYPAGIVDLDPASGEIARWDSDRTRRLIDVAIPGAIIGEYRAVASAAGRRWGLRPWLAATLPVPPGLVDDVLASDEAGLASAWVKRFGGPEGSGFVQLWSTQDVPPDPDELIRVAEYGLESPAHAVARATP